MAVQVLQGKIDFSYPTLPSPAQTWYQVYGNLTCDDPSIVPVIVLHGGPGLPHDYVLPIADLANEDMADGKPAIPVIFYDQIGNGLSTHYPEKKGDEAFWTIDLWIAELENLLQHFGFGSKQFDILGQSWGGMLGAEFAVRQPVGLRRLIISNSPASISLWKESMNRLRATLPSEVQDVLTTGEKEGQFDSEEYLNASQVFNEQFICRVTPWPQDLVDAFDWLTQKDPTVYSTLVGPSEFDFIGSLKSWSIIDSLYKIKIPTLLLNSRYDEAQDSVVQPYFDKIEKAKWYTFSESSHMPFWEERDHYMEVVGYFLRAKE